MMTTTRLTRMTLTLILIGALPTARGVAAEPSNDAPTPTPAAQVGAIMAEWDRVDSPGCAIGVVQNGELVFKRGYGQANLDHGVPITSRTVFDIGSTSKQFTAAAVALLAERGALSLDDAVRKHIPEMPDYGTPISIRHLIHHTSGIRDYLTVMALAGLEAHDVYTLDDVVELIARQRGLNFEPGAEHLYSNSGYMLLAEIVERVAEQPFAEFVDDNFFAPLGMADTLIYVDSGRVIPRRATGYSQDDERIVVDHYYNFAVPGDGQVYTTVEDLARWDRVFYDGGVGEPGFVDGLHTVGVLNSGKATDYAFGLTIGAHRGLDTVRHGGAWGGFRAQLLRFPSEHTSVVCLCNFGDIEASQIAIQVADVFLGDRYPQPEASDVGSEAETAGGDEPPAMVSAEALDRVAGMYYNPKSKYVRRILVSEGALVYSRGGDSRTELQPTGDGRFRMLGVGATVVVGFEPATGPVEHMFVEIGEDGPIRLEAVDEVAYTPQQLAAFAGTYRSSELDVAYRVEVEDEGLRVHNPSDSALFEPGFADFFSSADSSVTVAFQRSNGVVTGFVVNAGRVRDIEFTRVDESGEQEESENGDAR